MREQIKDLCRELKLPTVLARFEQCASSALRRGASFEEYLAELLEEEVAERMERRRARRIKEARFSLAKSIESFDFSRSPDLPQSLILELATGAYLDAKENIIFIGDCGTGKTHLATALGLAACEQGRCVRFTTVAQLAGELIEAKDARELTRTIARYGRVELLILDEMGFVPLSKAGAELVFQVISERCEKASIIITTNLPFAEWTAIFTDGRLCKAVVDRVTYRSHIIDTGDTSIRFEESLKRQKGGAKFNA